MAEIIYQNDRFLERGVLLSEFGDEFLVVCPKCKGMAKVIPTLIADKSDLFSPRQFICLNCVYRDTWIGNQVALGGNFDWYFQFPVWLQISFCNEILWAYNEAHLNFIEQYVSAKLRERKPKINKSLASRLPQWLKSRKNRNEILKAIGKLRTKLA